MGPPSYLDFEAEIDRGTKIQESLVRAAKGVRKYPGLQNAISYRERK